MESNAAMATAQNVLFLGGIVLLVGSVIGYVAQKLKVPDIVLFLLAGIVLGPQLTGVVNVDAQSALNQLILIFGASYILFEGGVESHLHVMKNVWITLALLATVGVLISALVVAPAAQFVFGIPFLVALLLGSTIAPTDPATLMPVFKQVTIKQRVAQTVVSESAFNDATGSIITVTILGLVAGSGGVSLGGSLVHLLEETGIGVGTGIILGYLALFLIAHEKMAFLREYMPLVSLMAVIGAYLGAENMQASGFMAAFVAGIMLGNRRLFGFTLEEGEQAALEHFVSTVSLIMRMFIFILLGSQVKFALLAEHWIGALIVVFVFMFIARPINVFFCTVIDRGARWTFKEQLFMCWVRETGVIPAALAGILLGTGAPHAKLIASVVFVAVLVTIVLQATTTKLWAAKLGLLEDDPKA